MADFQIEAEKRAITGKKVRQLRAQKLVPIVVYGPKTDPVHLQVPYRPLEVALMKAGGTHLIDINYEGGKRTVLAREVQRDAIRGEITHVDFLAVDVTHVIQAHVPVHVVGESPAVASREGSLTVNATSLTIEALPADLIERVEVDITGLQNVGDSLYVRDLTINAKVTITNDPDEMVVTITQIRGLLTETEEGEGPTITEPERISRDRDEDDK